LSLAIGLSLANVIRPNFFPKITDEDNGEQQEYEYSSSNQITTVISVTELPKLGGSMADSGYLTTKDFLAWQELFNQKKSLNVEITIENRNVLLTNRVKSQIYLRLKQSKVVESMTAFTKWLDDSDHDEFFKTLIRIWRESEVSIPQHEAIVKEIKKLQLNLSTERPDSGFQLMVSVYEILYNYGIEADTYFTETNSKGLINYFNDKLRHPPQISSQLTGFYDNLLSASLSGEYIKKLPLTFLDWMENFDLAVNRHYPQGKNVHIKKQSHGFHVIEHANSASSSDDIEPISTSAKPL